MDAVKKVSYPRLNVDLEKLGHNIKTAVKACNDSGIDVCGVVKGFNALDKAVLEFERNGCIEIGTSRMYQIKELKDSGMKSSFLLVRIPMISELEEVVEYADTSLNSDYETLRLLNDIAGKKGKTHKVILMADLGDLREGFWNKDELYECALSVENDFENLYLRGVGTNLGCYGSIRPTVDKMEELISIAEVIEEKIGRKLETISGGASTSFPLVLDGTMPERINHLRIGETITCAYDLPELLGIDIGDMNDDVFTMEAQIIEIKDKPTHPVGEICVDCFGRKPEYVDRGMRKRALLGAGKLDFAMDDKIFPVEEGIEVVGSSSDHLIIDIEDYKGKLEIGDIVTFKLSYPSVMYLSNDKYVSVEYV